MTTYDSIRHLLKQARDEADVQLAAGKVGVKDREAVQAFRDELGRLIEKMDPAGPGAGRLGHRLFELMQRCEGPLRPYRRFLEDALSVTGTETG